MDKKIDEKVIAEIKDQLLKQKEQLTSDLTSISRKDSHEADKRAVVFPEYGSKSDENAQEISDYSTNIVTQNVLEKSLEDVEKALKRIENNEYGICKYCHNPINSKRLIARPTASSCVSCKTELQGND